jgi:hypothetical protein
MARLRRKDGNILARALPASFPVATRGFQKERPARGKATLPLDHMKASVIETQTFSAGPS